MTNINLNKGDKLKFAATIGSKRLNEFMSAFDLRQPTKVFGKQIIFTITANGTKDLNHVFNFILQMLQKKFIVVWLSYEGKLTKSGRYLTSLDLTYRNARINELSNGKQCVFLNK